MTRVLIVDDEAISRRGLRGILEQETDAHIVGEAKGGREAIQLILELQPDVVLLDIKMPEVDGFDVVSEVGLERMPHTIFVTAYDEYALKAFDAHAVDYVLKPVDPERLVSSYLRAARQAEAPGGSFSDRVAQAVVDATRRHESSERLIVKDGGRIFFLRIRDIELMESDGNYVRLTVGPSTYFHRQPLKSLVSQIPQERFCQISRSTVINVEFVESLRPRSKGSYTVLLRGGQQVTSSRRYRDRLARFID